MLPDLSKIALTRPQNHVATDGTQMISTHSLIDLEIMLTRGRVELLGHDERFIVTVDNGFRRVPGAVGLCVVSLVRGPMWLILVCMVAIQH
jgi:hypothetical protein